MKQLLFVAALAIAGCAPRGELAFVDPGSALATERQTFWVAKFRPEGDAELEELAVAPARPDAPVFERHVVSVPPDRILGSFALPSPRRDASKEFLTETITDLGGLGSLKRELQDAKGGVPVPTLLFVHGYNVNHAEAVYGFAQFLEDYEVPVPSVLFSWPSAADVRGYIYDRDSVAISRKHLERLILELSSNGRPIVLAGHSMGSMLIMETLRQMGIRTPGSVGSRVEGVVLFSPDIDPEVFREQISHLRNVPEPFLVLTSDRDQALQVSGRIAGRAVRLGTITNPEDVSDLPVTLVDLSDLSDDRALNHSTYATSPTAIALIRKLGEDRFRRPPEELLQQIADEGMLGADAGP